MSLGATSAMTRAAKSASPRIEWDGDDSAQEAAEEGGDPLGGVFAPEDDAVAGAMPRRSSSAAKRPARWASSP